MQKAPVYRYPSSIPIIPREPLHQVYLRFQSYYTFESSALPRVLHRTLHRSPETFCEVVLLLRDLFTPHANSPHPPFTMDDCLASALPLRIIGAWCRLEHAYPLKAREPRNSFLLAAAAAWVVCKIELRYPTLTELCGTPTASAHRIAPTDILHVESLVYRCLGYHALRPSELCPWWPLIGAILDSLSLPIHCTSQYQVDCVEQGSSPAAEYPALLHRVFVAAYLTLILNEIVPACRTQIHVTDEVPDGPTQSNSHGASLWRFSDHLVADKLLEFLSTPLALVASLYVSLGTRTTVESTLVSRTMRDLCVNTHTTRKRKSPGSCPTSTNASHRCDIADLRAYRDTHGGHMHPPDSYSHIVHLMLQLCGIDASITCPTNPLHIKYTTATAYHHHFLFDAKESTAQCICKEISNIASDLDKQLYFLCT